MLFRSTPALSPGVAKLARRRPLSRIKVDDTPMPRRLAPLKPRWPEVPSVMLAPSDKGAVLALMLLKQFCRRGGATLGDVVAGDDLHRQGDSHR